MINRQQQPQQQQPQQQQQIGPTAVAEGQIYQTNVDPNSPHVQQTPIRGMSRSDIWKNLTFDRSWLQQTNKPVPAGTGAIPQYSNQGNSPELESSRHYPKGHPDDQEKYGNLNYQRGLGSLFGNLGGPRQPQQAFENQFSELQNQMGGFGEQFTGLETSIGGLGESITSITDRLDSIEQGIKGLKTNDTSQAYTRMNWQPFSEWGRRRN